MTEGGSVAAQQRLGDEKWGQKRIGVRGRGRLGVEVVGRVQHID